MEVSYNKSAYGIIEYTLKNGSGMTVKVINIGCSITEILVPDDTGKFSNVVLGYDNLEEYFRNEHFLGAVVAPVAGRVKDAEFTIGDETFSIEANEGDHLLHSGSLNLYNRIWESSIEGDRVVFHYRMGDEFPGKPLIKVMYSLDEDNALKLEYEVETDGPGIMAPTNHTYFNLSSDPTEDVSKQIIRSNFASYLKMDEDLIPLSVEVCKGIFDLKQGRPFKEVFENDDDQIEIANGGFDHYFMYEGEGGSVEVKDEASGRTLKMMTSFPGMVLYTGNNLGENVNLKDRKPQKHAGFCLETQESPAALKLPLGFDVEIDERETYKRETVFRFGVDK